MEPTITYRPAQWVAPIAVLLPTGLIFLLYIWTLAPSITWAHHGADGGELLAAAVTNGVPHPPGYPVYTLLLRIWLWMASWLFPAKDLAWRGHLFSAVLAALSVSVTILTASHILSKGQISRWGWAAVAGCVWGVSPLLWSQALITEVYAFHALIVVLLGWALFVHDGKPLYLVPIISLGVAHHLTFTLLLPATIYYIVSHKRSFQSIIQVSLIVGAGLIGGFCLYLRIPLMLNNSSLPSPINWGYADNLEGFWWLISGAAYQGYLFNLPSNLVIDRIAAWAYTLTTQFTPVGLGFVMVGLAHLDQESPRMRNLSLLWIVPISIYAVVYYTRDSEIYLLPAIWLCSLWLVVGLAVCMEWLQQRWHPQYTLLYPFLFLAFLSLISMTLWRSQAIALQNDDTARRFLEGTISVLEPESIIISSADAETFTLWYGAWASGELLDAVPNAVLVNYSLLQFPWYQRLLTDLYPDVPGIGHPLEELLKLNAKERPIFFSEELSVITSGRLEAVGPIWHYQPNVAP